MSKTRHQFLGWLAESGQAAWGSTEGDTTRVEEVDLTG